MANTPINPYGQSQGNQVTIGTGTRLCYVLAANDTNAEKKKYADAVCDGVHDEVELQQYINLAIANNRSLVLLYGTYILDAPTQKTTNNNDTFLLADLTVNPDSGGKMLIIEGEDQTNRPTIRLSNAAYEAIDNTKQMMLFSVYCEYTYGGKFCMNNLLLKVPWTQKKIVALDLLKFGGNAYVNFVNAYGYISGYNGNSVAAGNPPEKPIEGSIGIRFVGKGPNGEGEINNSVFSAFYEGISINTEWALCSHSGTNFCVYGWTFGHYEGAGISSTTHPIILINCGDERNVNLPRFYNPRPAGQGGLQDIELFAFSFERVASATPGKQLGDYATEETIGAARGVIFYTTGQGQGNKVNEKFWANGHGKNVHTINMAHARTGDTATRAAFAPTFMQKYYDTTLGKEVTCVDEVNKVWKDNAGNTVSNS